MALFTGWRFFQPPQNSIESNDIPRVLSWQKIKGDLDSKMLNFNVSFTSY